MRSAAARSHKLPFGWRFPLPSLQVYSFGTGAFGQFLAAGKDGMSTKNSPFVGFEDIAQLWTGRVVPAESFLARIGKDEPSSKKLEDMKVRRRLFSCFDNFVAVFPFLLSCLCV
jgi:hypothetical protein